MDFLPSWCPRYGLDRLFCPIVTSWQERSLDKGALAERALLRLGASIHPSEAVLIDNKAPNVQAWERRGGRGYLFQGEDIFRRDLRGSLRELAISAGMDVG